jgi:protein-L-isoaspartate(D-aspartate) O-methyltransferase
MNRPLDQDWAARREDMVARQIAARGVTDARVLAAMRKVPRHEFVPEFGRDEAYADEPLPIGYGQTISQPYIVAAMSEALALTGSERVLEIGTGSGYQTAVLAELTAEVYTIETVAPLLERAGGVLARLGYSNIRFRGGDGSMGWPEEAPFDAVLAAAAPAEIPAALRDQLAPGGRLVLPVGSARQDLVLIRRREEGFEERSLFPVRFVPMIRGGPM